MQDFKHPHIIKYYHSFIDGSYFYILMEHASGGDLYKLMQKHSQNKVKFSEKQLWKWAYEILLALEYLHSNNIIHWDLKASNIFLQKKRIKIGDFGWSKVLNPAKMYLSESVGTTVYLSPEQVNHVTVYDHKIDIWAVGCCLYNLWCFKPPFSGTSFSILSYSILNDEPSELPSEYSEEFKTFITKSLTKIPKDRPSAIDLCLFIPTTIINSYTAPKHITAASTSFMKITKSAAGRQKSPTKRKLAQEALLINTSVELTKHNKIAISTQNTFHKKSYYPENKEENKSSMLKLGDRLIKEKPYKWASKFEGRKFSQKSSSWLKDKNMVYRVSRVRDISALALESKFDKMDGSSLLAKSKPRKDIKSHTIYTQSYA